MSYAEPRNPGRRLTGLVVTVALHIVLIYALIHGLARQIVEAVLPPLETKIIEDVKPPAPDKPPPPPPPKLATPPPPFIPPPEVQIQVQVQAPTITAVTPTPPAPAPVARTPPPPVAHVPVRTPPVVQAASCDKPPYPPGSRRANETGTVLLSFLVDVDGKVLESKIERSSGYRRLDEAAREGLELCRFKPATLDGKPTRAWGRLEYVWTLQ